MKKFYLVLISLLIWNSCTEKNNISTTKIENIIHDEAQRDQLLFTRLMAIALNKSIILREKIYELSKQKDNLFYKEILIKDLLLINIDGETVNEFLESLIKENYIDLEIPNYTTFISNLMKDLPLLVIKIPDWLIDDTWDFNIVGPRVFSNLICADNKVFGFENNGTLYMKPDYFKSNKFELVVKNSEDYFLIKDKNILKYFQSPCMNIDQFIQRYCKIWNTDILVKKRDLQYLFEFCTPEMKTISKEPLSDCPRTESNESNYLTTISLSSPSILKTLHNDNCIAGEETFDFQADFIYGIRTSENEISFSEHLMVPFYGLRYSELFNPDGSLKTYYIFNNSIKKSFDFIYFIDKNAQGWDRDKLGNNIVILWNEVDILNCNDKKYFDKEPISYSYDFLFNFVGKDKIPNSKYNISKFGYFRVEGSIFGQNIIPFGWNNYAYCAGVKTIEPSGPQQLKVGFEIILHD